MLNLNAGSESWMLSRLLRLRQGRRRNLRLGGGCVYLIDQISISHFCSVDHIEWVYFVVVHSRLYHTKSEYMVGGKLVWSSSKSSKHRS